MAVSPYYVIHRFRDDYFKIVAFKGVRDPDHISFRDTESQKVNEEKLANNISRARSMVLQYALCNPWDFFITVTINKDKHNRYDLDSFVYNLNQFIRDMRKKYGAKISYLLIPQKHEKDGAWHMHGFVSGIPADRLRKFEKWEPYKLWSKGYLSWVDYERKFGFNSIGKIKDQMACSFYMTRYISRDLANMSEYLHCHLYYHSRPLNKAEKVSEVYLPSSELDSLCTEEFKFCNVGAATPLNVPDLDWSWPLHFDGVELQHKEFFPLTQANFSFPDFDPSTIDPDYEQITFDGFQFTDPTEAFK